jgi:hypothetical protein
MWLERGWMRNLLAVVVALGVSACGSNPLNPLASDPPTRGSLHVGVDISTCYQLGPVTVSVDGTVVGTVVPGSAGLTTQVAIGTHSVSGLGITTDRLHSTTWAPYAVDVPAGGYNFTMYCTSTHGYSVTPADARP